MQGVVFQQCCFETLFGERVHLVESNGGMGELSS